MSIFFTKKKRDKKRKATLEAIELMNPLDIARSYRNTCEAINEYDNSGKLWGADTFEELLWLNKKLKDKLSEIDILDN